MARKTAEVTLEDLSAKVDGKLPPVLTGPANWAPVGYLCRPEDVREMAVPGHRKATAKDRAAFAAEWNKERAAREAAPTRPAPAPQPVEPARDTPRAEKPSDYVARCLAEPGPAPLPADIPVAFYDPDGADYDPLPIMRPLRRADW